MNESEKAVTQHQAHWYCIDKSGMTTLCADKADALQNAKLAQEMWPHNGPHRAAQLFEHPPAQAGQSEPVAHQYQAEDGTWHPFMNDAHRENTIADGRWPIRALFTGPAPVRQPLTDTELLDIADDFKSQYMHAGTTFDEFDSIGFARAVEAAHGITAQKAAHD